MKPVDTKALRDMWREAVDADDKSGDLNNCEARFAVDHVPALLDEIETLRAAISEALDELDLLGSKLGYRLRTRLGMH